MNDFALFALLVAAAIIVWLWSQYSHASQEAAKSQSEVNRISGRIQQEAMKQFQAWRLNEIEGLKRQEAEAAGREAQVKLAEWKVASEAAFRADAVQRSRSVIVGKVTEHVVPYLPEFNYNPKDARFIGSPVDFVVFDGFDQGAVQQVVFIEGKTGASSLNKRERQVRDAVLARNAAWKDMRVAVHQNRASGSPCAGREHRWGVHSRSQGAVQTDWCGQHCREDRQGGIGCERIQRTPVCER